MSDTELLPKSKAEPVRRLEVFTGAGRRREWSAEEKKRIVAESYQSGETVSAVARRHALTPQQLFGWRRALRRGMDLGARGTTFAPVMVEAGPGCADRSTAAGGPSAAAIIEIVIGVAMVRIPPGIDAVSLTKVLRAVKATT
jgi:transposase